MIINKFLLHELEEAGLKENEFEEAESDLKGRAIRKQSKPYLPVSITTCNSRNNPWCNRSGLFTQQLEPFRNYHEKFPEILQRLQSSLHIEMQDIAGEIESVNEEIQYDAAQIEKFNERIHTGYKLFKKHHVHTTSELIQLQQELGKQITEYPEHRGKNSCQGKRG